MLVVERPGWFHRTYQHLDDVLYYRERDDGITVFVMFFGHGLYTLDSTDTRDDYCDTTFHCARHYQATEAGVHRILAKAETIPHARAA